MNSLSVNRSIRRATYHNAFLWGIGNGLFSTSLVIYLIRDLCGGKPGPAVSATAAWIIAAPRIAGVFRLFVPALIERLGNRKKFCIACYLIAPVILCGIPDLLPGMVRTCRSSNVLTMLVVFWCVYHLAENFGTVALWSWYGDLVPQQIRGRFLGKREARMIAGQTLGFAAAGLYTYFTVETMPKDVPRWTAYLEPAYWGIGFCLLSVLPLFNIPEIPQPRQESAVKRLRGLLAPLADRRFAAFVFFGCWVQMSIGLTQEIQFRFSVFFIGITMLVSLAMQTETRIGQWMIGPGIGKLLDRIGTFPVMVTSLMIVAAGSLFYYAACPSSWGLLFGAATVWIFWIGVNIGVWKTVLDTAPKGKNADYLAVYITFTTLTLAVFTLLGGYLIPQGFERQGFLWSFVLRLAAVPVLWLTFRRRSRK
jgi:MFS family permease